MAKDLTAALQALTEQANGQTSRVDKSLPAAKTATGIPPREGASGPIAGAAGSIASPLTENDFTKREFHDGGWTTTDGLIALPAIKKIVMTDAHNAEVVFNYAAPPA
jgi:hypothetical protein